LAPLTVLYLLSLHDALPIWTYPVVLTRVPSQRSLLSSSDATTCWRSRPHSLTHRPTMGITTRAHSAERSRIARGFRWWSPTHPADRKSTRLNSSHQIISYAV